MPDDFVAEVVGGEPKQEETPSSEAEQATPSEETTTEGETPEVEPEGETPSETLYDLPDGRKATAEEVLNEYKNLHKDYTHKSQKLASYEKQSINKDNNVPEYRSPEWQPQTYSEIVEAAKAEIYRDFEETRKAEEAQEQQLSEQVESQLEEVRKLDPKFNENKLLEHATKYKIPDLVSAYHNMKEMNDRIEAVRAETAKNLQKRAADPVSGNLGQEVPVDSSDVYDPSVSRGSLIDALRQLKQK